MVNPTFDTHLRFKLNSVDCDAKYRVYMATLTPHDVIRQLSLELTPDTFTNKYYAVTVQDEPCSAISDVAVRWCVLGMLRKICAKKNSRYWLSMDASTFLTSKALLENYLPKDICGLITLSSKGYPTVREFIDNVVNALPSTETV